MEKSISQESGYSDSTCNISEPPDITNWFSSYVYESFQLSSLPKETETQVDEFSVRDPDQENLGVAVSKSKSPEKFVLNKDHNPMNKRMTQISNESLLSEPLDIESGCIKETETKFIENNVCPRSFEQELVSSSQVEDFSQSQSVLASDGLELSALGNSEYVKETQTENETAKVEGNNVCPSLFEQELVTSAKVTDFSQSQSVLSEPPDVRNWFSSYEYQSPQLSDIHEFGFSSPEKNQLIIDESDTEEETSSGIFRKAKSKQDDITPCRLESNGCRENVAADTAKEISSDYSYPDQGMKNKSSIGLFDASTKELKQQSSFSQEPLFREPIEKPSFSLGISQCSPKPQSPSKNDPSSHELRPKHIQETISMNSTRQKSPRKAARKVCLEENLESTDQESDDKENVHDKRTETGFVTLKKARFREAIDQCSMKKPNRRVLVECSSRKELQKIAREKDQEEERKKKRRVLGEMSNHQFPEAEEIAGKWRCPQKKKGKSVPPLKQLRLDAWIHKV
ncbi:hypothetical protein AALP_AAs66747U001400 [Arabis alpina]|uniref:Uncharacterized protein n=1 Tax=Arabis alpina TaxID=50452 RepID=A0A087FXA8_ARAAL|nr:hypothetical protein AALP_AAs66747U001400 [Arabis alpina]